MNRVHYIRAKQSVNRKRHRGTEPGQEREMVRVGVGGGGERGRGEGGQVGERTDSKQVIRRITASGCHCLRFVLRPLLPAPDSLCSQHCPSFPAPPIAPPPPTAFHLPRPRAPPPHRPSGPSLSRVCRAWSLLSLSTAFIAFSPAPGCMQHGREHRTPD